jgi:hypothetical protein
MYYLTFLARRATVLLQKQGFDVVVRRDVFPLPYRRLVLVTATRR